MYIYVVRGGFLDGWPGLWYCLLRLGHEIHITVKLAESRWNGTRSVSGEPRKGCESKAQSLDEARPVAGAVAGERSVST
jgi:hypothetical protein